MAWVLMNSSFLEEFRGVGSDFEGFDAFRLLVKRRFSQDIRVAVVCTVLPLALLQTFTLRAHPRMVCFG